MPTHHRLSRRLFLTELGRRTFAVAVLGTAAAACSSEADNGSASPAEDASGDSSSATTTTTATEPEQSDARADDPAPEGALLWERANFGSVSAYVLARGNEVAIVDTGTRGNPETITEALGALSLGWSDVNHVILTHAHGDHTGGLDSALMSAPTAIGYAGTGDLPQITAPRDLVALNGGEEVFGLEILATPGHTPGHISPYDPTTGLLVAGDAMIVDGGELSGPVEQFSTDIDLARATVRDMADLEVETILVGHGDPLTDAGGALAALAAEL